MDDKWELGDRLSVHDSLLDGFTFQQLIDALHCERVINEKTARKVLDDILGPLMQDMNFLFEKNLDAILALAKKGREVE